jgi:hypothetical protein
VRTFFGLIFCIGLSGCSDFLSSGRAIHTYQESPVRDLLSPNYRERIPDISDLDIREYADVVRAIHGIQTEYIQDEDLDKVTRKYGRSTIDLSTLPYRSPMLDTGARPWSSWWYPKFEKTLFDGGNSPLEKYDHYRYYHYVKQGRRGPPNAAAQIERTAYDPRALSWEGLCNAWAFASILHPEPRVAQRFRLGNTNVTFDILDQKALLLKTYEGIHDDEIEVYGQKFTGDHTGWIHPDPFPDQVHRFIEEMIGTRRQPFIMDHDAGVEIWNVPVFKANYTIESIPGRKDAVQVRLWLYTAAPLRKDQMNLVGTQEMIREYHYVLLGKPKPGNQLDVRAGVWIVGPNGTDSRRSHPDYFITIPDRGNVTRESFNAAIETHVVDRILSGKEI